MTNLSEQALADAAIPKSGPFLDIVAALGAAGILPSKVTAKVEGLAFGPDVDVNGEVEHTLFVSNDNDFLSQVPLADGALVDNPNQFLVFGFTDADLTKFGVDEFVPQEIASIPEPSSWGGDDCRLPGARLHGDSPQERSHARQLTTSSSRDRAVLIARASGGEIPRKGRVTRCGPFLIHGLGGLEGTSIGLAPHDLRFRLLSANCPHSLDAVLSWRRLGRA